MDFCKGGNRLKQGFLGMGNTLGQGEGMRTPSLPLTLFLPPLKSLSPSGLLGGSVILLLRFFFRCKELMYDQDYKKAMTILRNQSLCKKSRFWCSFDVKLVNIIKRS